MTQRLIPGIGFIDDAGLNGQYLIPGIGFIDSSSGSSGSSISLVLDTGTYSLTGISQLMQKQVSLPLGSGVYTITGQDINLGLDGSYRLYLDSGVYNIVGITPNVGVGVLLESGNYTVTGSNVRLVSSTEPVLVSNGPSTISISIKIGL